MAAESNKVAKGVQEDLETACCNALLLESRGNSTKTESNSLIINVSFVNYSEVNSYSL